MQTLILHFFDLCQLAFMLLPFWLKYGLEGEKSLPTPSFWWPSRFSNYRLQFWNNLNFKSFLRVLSCADQREVSRLSPPPTPQLVPDKAPQKLLSPELEEAMSTVMEEPDGQQETQEKDESASGNIEEAVPRPPPGFSNPYTGSKTVSLIILELTCALKDKIKRCEWYTWKMLLHTYPRVVQCAGQVCVICAAKTFAEHIYGLKFLKFYKTRRSLRYWIWGFAKTYERLPLGLLLSAVSYTVGMNAITSLSTLITYKFYRNNWNFSVA